MPKWDKSEDRGVERDSQIETDIARQRNRETDRQR